MKYERKSFLGTSFEEPAVACGLALSGRLTPLLNSLARSRPVDVNRPSPPDGRTPLHRACAAGDLPIAQLLIWVRYIIFFTKSIIIFNVYYNIHFIVFRTIPILIY